MNTTVQTTVLTLVAMVAFAANSVLCRLALGQGLIDAASFTSVRVMSGAATLAVLVLLQHGAKARGKVAWRSVAALSTYMVCFSFAYLSLSTGTGALILFGAVQITMFLMAMRAREHFPPASWAGLALAIAGLVYLVSPGITAPDPAGAVMMAIAGIAWGFYSLFGRGTASPLVATARNFVLSVPIVLVVSVLAFRDFELSASGVMLAMAAGAIASGVGYAVWYAALRGLTATRAATVQLSVPAIAALGGVVLLSEEPTTRLLIASAATLGGVAVVLAQRRAKTPA